MRTTRSVLAMMGACLLLPGAAAAASLDAVTIYSDGDFVGGGLQRLYTPADAEIGVSGTTAELEVTVTGGTYDDSFRLAFAAPRGQVLEPGVYDRAERTPFREDGHPGIEVAGEGRGCNDVTGRFEVKDFVVTPDGLLERLWIVYEHHCEGGGRATFGEVRLGIPGAAGPVAVASSVVRWPVTDFGRSGVAVPVTLMADGPAQLGTASVAGTHPADFEKRSDDCSGATLAAGDWCEVWLKFVPGAPGTRTALLRIPAGGVTHEVALQGFDYGGRTRVILHSDPGDSIGGGRNYSYTLADSIISAGARRERASFGVDHVDGAFWNAEFAAAPGDALVAGQTYTATRWPFSDGAGMSVTGNGYGCNQLSGTFTVTDARLDADGRLRAIGIDFEQHCENRVPALRGTWEFRAGDTTPPPPWMVSGPGTSGPPVSATNPFAPPAPPAAAPSPASAGSGGGAATAAPRPRCARSDLPRLSGTRRADRLAGTRRAERILVGAGSDRVLARGGADCVDGGAGDDTLAGGGGSDRLYGGGGDDVLVGGPGHDLLDCGAGRHDVARGVTRSERVIGCERVIRAR